MTPRPALSPLYALAFMLVAAGLAPAAVPAATIRGTVSDPDGRVVPNARVILIADTAIVAATEADSLGAFAFTNLTPRTYELHVAREGFRAEPAVIRLSADEDCAVALRLQISAFTESVVISAAQAEMPLSRAPASVTVITREDLRAQQVETVAGALSRVPGLSVQQSGGRGAIVSLLPRGGESNYTLVLVDGVPMNAFGGEFDFAHLGVAGIDRVEVVRGPQSAVHGGGAIGAVIQVITDQSGPPRLEGSVEAGGSDTSRLALSSAGTRGQWGWHVSGERLATSGYTGSVANSDERMSNDDYLATHVALGGSWNGPRRAAIRGDVRVAENGRGFPGPWGSDPAGLFPGVDRVSRGTNRTRTFAAHAAFDWTPRVRPAMQVSYADLEGEFASPYGVSSSATTRLTARALADVRARQDVGLSLGFEFLQERAASTFITDAAFEQVPIRRSIVGPFAEVRYTRDSRLFVVGGLRVEWIRRDALPGNDDPFVPRPAFARDLQVAPTPRLSASYYLQPAHDRARGWTRIHASAAAGIRPPDAFEIAFTDNPSLRPERSRSADAGVEQALAAGTIVIDATAFFNRYDDLIVAVGRSLADASQYRTDNISNARANGLEVSAAVRTRFGLEATVAYTLLDTEILSVDGLPGQAPPPFTPGDGLPRRPRHQTSVGLTWQQGRVTAFAHVGGRGSMRDVEPNYGATAGLFDAAGYLVTDAGVSVAVGRGVEVFGRIRNLFDRRYEETLGYPAPPRSAMVGVRLAARD